MQMISMIPKEISDKAPKGKQLFNIDPNIILISDSPHAIMSKTNIMIKYHG